MSGADDEIDVKVSLIDALSAKAQVVAKSIDKIGDEARQSAAELKVLQKALDDAGDEALQSAAKMEAADAATGDLGKSADGASASMEKLSRSTNKAVRSMERMGRLRRMFRFLTKLSLLGVVLDGLTQLVTLLNGVGAAAGAAVAGLSPLVGLLASIPGLVGSVVIGFVAMRLATAGLGEAFKNMGDAAKFNEAMKELSPNARKFATAVRGLRGPWARLQDQVQDNFFAGMDTEIEALSSTYLPIMRRELGITSRMLNRIFLDGGAWLRGNQGRGLMESAVVGSRENLGYLTRGVGNLGKVVLSVMDAARPMTKRMSEGFEAFTANLFDTSEKNKSGLTRFLNSAYDRWLGIKDVTWDYFTGMYGLFKAADPLVDHMGEQLGKIGERFTKWANSKEGQKAIGDWWESMIPVVDELGRLVRDIGKFWADIAADPDDFVRVSKMFREGILPAVERILEAMSGKFLESFVKILDAIADLAESGALDGVAIVLSGFASALGSVASVVDAFDIGKLVGIIGALLLAKRLAGLAGIGMPFLPVPGRRGGRGGRGGPGGRVGGGRGDRGGRHRGPGRFGGRRPGIGLGVRGFGGYGSMIMGGSLLSALAGGKDRPVTNGERLGIIGGGAMTGNPYAFGASAAIAAMTYASSWKTPEELARRRAQNARSSEIIQQQRANAYDQMGRPKLFGPGNGAAFSKLNFPVKVDSNIDNVRNSLADLGKDLGDLAARKRFIDLTPKGQDAARTAIDRIKASIDNLPFIGNKKPSFGDDRRTPRPTPVQTPKVTPKVVQPKVGKVKDQSFNVRANNSGALSSINITQRALNGLTRTVAKPKIDVKTGNSRSMIDNVRSALNGLRDRIVNVNVRAQGIKQTSLAISRMGQTDRWTGGPVTGGMAYRVNELGPEAFVSSTGKISMLPPGEHIHRFGQSGEVIPASATQNPFAGHKGLASDAAMGAYRDAFTRAMLLKAQGGTQGEGDSHYHYHQHGDITNNSPIDMEREFRKFIEAARRREKERT